MVYASVRGNKYGATAFPFAENVPSDTMLDVFQLIEKRNYQNQVTIDEY